MSLGTILLIGITVLIFMGLAERVLDRLRLSDKAAITIIIAMVLASIFIPDINITERVSFNIGGFIIPMGLAIYLFVKAETGKEKWRAVIAAIVAGTAIWLVQRYVLPAEPEAQRIDPNYVYGIMGGLIAYILGRSRRSAFVAGIVGVFLSDTIQLVYNIINGLNTPTRYGGAGAFDTAMIAGVLAVIIAEVVGETRERLQGGTSKKDMHFEKGHFVSSLGNDDKTFRDKKDNIINISLQQNDKNDGGDQDEK
ncbi:DUF1614 domain-containing protein [Serpentinicella alkaliphila]|uniref:Uncharacterized protein DUF1614 n=1 Tax=Serpentinicella alkaliphila TaxID=1734049 RepID=A0A4R2T9Y0_9FIRM|nr:DUF1614 domain-containing protein [Serpentinicella alkaliphila]QUH26082.1 DUF1614 domain-containing protein [Serpentinicella alkaliphila]TCP99095.1 uncharacterized protein DUF1614 [Serpentinicella alkaliphila]